MDVREKLVELLKEIVAIQECGFGDPRPTYETVASYLISHGVTVQEWISVKDMPFDEYDYKPILYYDGKNVDVCFVINGKFVDAYSEWGETIEDVTHWQPLPQPPKGE